MSERRYYRLVTRSDFDGLVCAALLRERDLINDITFVHPKDMQDGKVEITSGDITTNLPFVEGCHMAFDHHQSEIMRLGAERPQNHILDPNAPSAARVVCEYFGGKKAFPNVSAEMLEAVDRGDSADFTMEQVLNPQGWVLMNFLMDARTGMGRFREFRISNYQLMMQLIDACRTLNVEQILQTPDVAERVEMFKEHTALAREQLRRCGTVHGTAIVVDLRQEETIYTCNRFLIYALNPECNISIHALWGLRKQNTVFAIGNSIFNRSSPVNIGELALRYGGGGHANAGTCQIPNTDAERVLGELIETIATAEEQASGVLTEF